jgi:hypothetical protein
VGGKSRHSLRTGASDKMSLKLTDAIEANANGLKHLIAERDRTHATIDELTQKKYKMNDEIAARQNLQISMRALQACFPEDETIKFVIPNEYD